MSDLFSTRHDAFLNLMAGGSGTASLTRADIGLPPLPEGPDAITHSCGGCEDDAPCSGCGGGVKLEGPAYKAFDWAIAMTAAITNPFQRAAKIGDTLRNAPARDDSADWLALEGLVRNEMDLMIAREQGTNASAAMLRLGGAGIAAGAITPPPTEKRTTPLPDGTEITYVKVSGDPFTPATGGNGKYCCPFMIYPLPVPKPYKDQFPPDGWMIGHDFGALAIYSDDAPCSCSCCVFRQYIHTEITGTGQGPKRPDPQNSNKLTPTTLPFVEHREDANFAGTSHFGRGQSSKCGQAGQHESCENVGKSTDPNILSGMSAQAQAALRAIVSAENLKSYCIEYLKDSPGLVLGKGDNKKRLDCFLGVVKTKCPSCSVVLQSSFQLYVSGSNTNGVLSQPGWPPLPTAPGTTTPNGFNPDATCIMPPGSSNDC